MIVARFLDRRRCAGLAELRRRDLMPGTTASGASEASRIDVVARKISVDLLIWLLPSIWLMTIPASSSTPMPDGNGRACCRSAGLIACRRRACTRSLSDRWSAPDRWAFRSREMVSGANRARKFLIDAQLIVVTK